MKKVVYILPIQPAGGEKLKEKYEVVVLPSDDRETVLSNIQDADAVVLRLTRFGKEYMDAAPNLKVIARNGVGVDTVDVAYATKKGIPVVTTGSANSLPVAEHAFISACAIYKKFVHLDAEVRKGNWKSRDEKGALDLHGKSVGLIGFGKIGSAFAKMAIGGFDMKVYVYDPFISEETAAKNGVVLVKDLDELCKTCDIFSVHTHLTPETRGMIGEHELSLMKPSAVLVNCARGGIYDEKALIKALREKRILGAAVDVFENEPLNADSAFLGLDNVLLTPHSAAMTDDCKKSCSLTIAADIDAVLEGRDPVNVANPDYKKFQ